MLRLFLIRHGETHWNQERRIQGSGSDIDLSEVGRRQAETLALLLRGEKISAIYSSPLKRALNTAQAIADYHHMSIETVSDLREIEAGKLEGVSLASLGSTLSQFLVQWQHGEGLVKLPGGESLAELQERAWTAIQYVLERHGDGVVIIVSHCFVILSIVCKALGLSLSYFPRLKVDVASLSILDFEDEAPQLVTLNSTSHLT